ncbi:McrBC 5-methylcytosine restriction system component [Flexivirga endophytica]|uniref:McrBC 5-methylcytosine restriction system component n=1 Tax=Flexivirga endophytica TaxID=1849103 RepID=A0A916SV76_9MICO|nr:restriction endonuclease [Flexivirga endophytica]GGB17861.1 McrBC 5-methylcytosine restriction system component [Flexivirga endophytica]GHB37748.1 McrBC 5-methylcytosine restriction system component [Flexivirga endophytica]
MSDIQLREHGESVPIRLGSAARTALLEAAADKITVVATADPERVILRTGSWVGALAVPGCTIRVEPRAPMENLFTMFSAGLPGDAWGSDAVGWSADSELVDGVAAFLLRAIDTATRRGLLHGYVTLEEDTSVIRGRLLVDQLATRPWAAATPPCRYDEFTPDIAENRLLLCAVRQVLTWPDLPPLVRRDGLRLVQRFEGVEVTGPDDHHGEIPVTRLNEHYAPALELARKALDGITIRHLDGSQTAHAFMVDMDDLFRRWITVELTNRLWPDISLEERPQYALDVQDQWHFTPDLLLRRDLQPVLVGNVAYHLAADRRDGSDFYPLLAYASALDLEAGLLIYAHADEAPASEVVVRSIGTRLLCVPLRLNVPAARLAGSLDTLAELVRVVSYPRQAAYAR